MGADAVTVDSFREEGYLILGCVENGFVVGGPCRGSRSIGNRLFKDFSRFEILEMDGLQPATHCVHTE